MKKIVFLFVLGFIVSCQLPSSLNGKKSNQDLLYKTWILQDENGDVLSYNGQAINLQFMKESEIRASGFSGCNRYFSTVNLDESSIRFEQVGATLMACPEMETEQMFLDLLPKIDRYELHGNELTLYQGKIVLFRFVAK